MSKPKNREPRTVVETRAAAAARDEQAWLLPLKIGTAWWNMMIDLSFGPATVHHRYPDRDRSLVPDRLKIDKDHGLFA
jgi:hypothetical protein